MPLLRLSAVDVDLETGALGDGSRLATTELALLTWLAEHPGEDVSRDRLLRDVWKYPGQVPETRAVDLAMARLRRKVERDPSNPDHLVTVQGTGYRFVPRSLPGPSALPRPANRYVGRGPEGDRIRALLDGGARLVTLVGPGGVGKTRLALEVASDRPGASFCDASETRDEGSLAAAVHLALCGPARGRPRSLDLLLAELGPALLVLDNVEQVAAIAAGCVPGWLQHAPELVLVVTSREPLGVAEEHLVDVVPLLGPRAGEAVLLLVERARQMDVILDPDDPDVAELARRVDGLPLGLELAAARLRTRRPAEISGDLGGLRRGGPARHQSLDSAVAWSWGLLADDERDALAALAELRGAWPMSAAEALGVATERVEGLVQRSLVQRYPETSRWGLLETVRRFARPHQRDPRRAADLHLAWCVREADTPSLADLGAALDHALDSGSPQIHAAFRRLRDRVFAAGPLDRLEQVIRSTLDRAEGPELTVSLQVDLALVLEIRGDLAGATRVLRQAGEVAAAEGEAHLVASAEGNLASALLRLGAIRSALELAGSAVEAARRSGDPRVLAMRLQLLAGLELQCGRLERARDLLDEAIRCAEPWPATSGSLLHLRAGLLHTLGQPVEALLDAAARRVSELPRLGANVGALRIASRQDLGDWGGARALLPGWERSVAAFPEDVVLETVHAVVLARDLAQRGDRAGAVALLDPLLESAGPDRWVASRVTPHLLPLVPRDRALALADAALAEARREGAVLDEVHLLAGLCTHPDTRPDELRKWRAEGAARCDSLGVAAGGWLRQPFGGGDASTVAAGRRG